MNTILGLHSHSGLERELNMSTKRVLIDAKFAPMFSVESLGEAFERKGVKYVEVDTLIFVQKGGVFKNYNQ